ncbi:hypothetical protein KQX54_012987 [Cotesia glomerata]|uniref:BEN domain-containing protein n=1 Tax=Cotesia glomerata TaxID=32391 RepID=A0AAV7IDB0_COTGL|nr:hypothetical protein KQX54_012987 [Cotesia glomerata]
MQTLLKLQKEIKDVTETQGNMMYAQMNQGVQSENRNDQVEIGHQGSQVFVTRAQWDTADSRETFEKMGVSLVSCLFATEELLASNLRGGKSKINKNAPQKPALNQVIISAIQEAAKNKFPATFKKSLFGMAINNHVTALRHQNNIPVEPDATEEPLMNAEQ